MSIATVTRPKSVGFLGRTGLAYALMAAILMSLVAVFFGGAPAFANDDSAARDKLITSVTSQIADKQYRMDQGGYINGSQLVNDKGEIINENYDRLDSNGRSQLVSDIVDTSNKVVQKDNASTSDPSATTVTTSTQTSWLKELQNTPGFGSKILTEVLKNTKPDLVTANQMWMPFSGPVSTFLGFATILIFIGFAITVVLDLCYIVIPMFRMFLGGGDGEEKAISKVISGAAKRAVEEEENDSNGKGALGVYFKKSALKMFVLGICLVYLISGQLWVAVGWFLDLLGSKIGF